MSWETNYLNFKNTATLNSLKALEARQKAFDRFLAQGLPSKKEEAWKFTSLSDFKSIEWKMPTEEEVHLTHDQMQEVSRQLPSDFLNVVFVNGILNPTLSDDLDEVIDISELKESDFDRSEQHAESRILNLSKAFLTKAINLKVAKNKTIEKVVHLLFVQSSKNSVYCSEKINIHLQENSEMKLLVHSLSFVNSTADALNLNMAAQVDDSARLVLVQLQNEDLNSYHFSQTEIQLGQKSQVTTLSLNFGNHLIRNYCHLKFNSSEAQAGCYGLAVMDHDQHVDNYTFIQHAIGGNNSTQQYKSILAGSSRSAFRGRVMIEPNAQKANSEQLNNNLLLTRTAQADSVPQLEIFADDVKASHGATFGQLNKDEIFYFLSRGINQFQAVKMLSFGYALELIQKIENHELQKYLTAALAQKLENMVKDV